MKIHTFYMTFTLEEIMNEDKRPDRNDFYTQKEFFKELKCWEIRNGLHKPTRRDFRDETEYQKQLAIYNRAINRLKNI